MGVVLPSECALKDTWISMQRRRGLGDREYGEAGRDWWSGTILRLLTRASLMMCLRAGGCTGQAEDEAGAGSVGGLEGDGAVVGVGDRAGDGEPEAGAAAIGAPTYVEAGEALEDPLAG